MTADEYIKQGYRVTSRRHHTISKIDRDDWKEYMAMEHSPWDLDAGRKWVTSLGNLGAADFYRRCHSRDDIVVSSDIIKLIPNSCDLL